MARRPATASAKQVDIGARLKQGIGGGLNSLDTRNGVKNDVALFRLAVRHRRVQNDLTEFHLGATLRPADRRVIKNISSLGQLYDNVKLEGTCRDALPDVVDKEVGAPGRDGGGIQVLVAEFRQNAVAAKTAGPSAALNLNAETAKNDSRAKLVGIGLGAWTNCNALGCAPKYCSIALG